MIDRYYIQKLLGGTRSTLIGALILVVLIGSLHTVASTVPVNANKADYSAAQPSIDDYLCIYPVAPTASDHEGMTTDSRPFSNASTHWILPLIVKTDNTVRRLSLEPNARLSSGAEVIAHKDCCSLCTSAPLVCSHLGRQFTLVGAKPSGTS